MEMEQAVAPMVPGKEADEAAEAAEANAAADEAAGAAKEERGWACKEASETEAADVVRGVFSYKLFDVTK